MKGGDGPTNQTNNDNQNNSENNDNIFLKIGNIINTG
jgi:hypothetical protein